jgi:predicted nucleotidyltransferase
MVHPEEAAKQILLENEKEQEELDIRRREARKLAGKLAREILKKSPESKKVWGFGSTFDSWRSYRKSSDIDLAVESGDIMELLPLVEGYEYNVDLVDISSTSSEMADRIHRYGILLGEV